MDPKLYRAVASGNESSFDELMMGSDPILLQKTTEGNTVLHVAALNKQIKIAEKIMEFGSCASLLLYHQNSDKDTPLHIAARVGCAEILQLLIDLAESAGNRDLEAQRRATRIVNDREDTVLHVAVYYGHLNVVKVVIPKDPDLLLIVNSVGDSPIFMAIVRNFFKVAKFLLGSSNEYCSLRGRDGMNALHAAVAHLGSGHQCNLPHDKLTEMLEVIKEMKNKFPSSILEEDDHGWTPFHHASKFGCTDVVEMLLSDDNYEVAYKKDKKGLSAFHVAAEIGDTRVMEKLIRHCPDIWELLSNNGQTALHVAVKGRNKSAINYLSSLSSWDVLLNKQDRDGNTPLHLATLLEDNTIIRLLIKKKVDKRVENKEGLTALDILISSRTYYPKENVIKWFKCKEGFSPFGLRRLLRIRNTEVEPVDETKRKLEDAYHINKDDESRKTSNCTLHVSRGTFGRFKTIDGGLRFSRIVTPWSHDVYNKSYNNQNAVIAALIATVTFAAAFQIPGGYENDGPYKGLPILRHKLLFNLFMLLDSIALALSCLSIFSYFWHPDVQGNSKSAQLSIIANFMALMSMVSAFMLALMLISSNYWFLKVVALICGACFFSKRLVWIFGSVRISFILITQYLKTHAFIASTRKLFRTTVCLVREP